MSVVSLPRRRPEEPKNAVIELRAALNDLNRYRLPTDEQLERIDELVRRLATARSKRPILTGWEHYCFVDRREKSLKLVHRLGNVLDRCSRELQETRQQPVTQTAFYRIWLLSKSNVPDASLAEELLTKLGQLRTNRIAPKQIDWKKYHPILCRSAAGYIELKTGRCLPYDQRDTACYARGLEILQELPDGLRPPEIMGPVLTWLRETGACELPSKENDLVPGLLEYDFFGRAALNWRRTRAENRLTRKREKARIRQKRHRAKEK